MKKRLRVWYDKRDGGEEFSDQDDVDGWCAELPRRTYRKKLPIEAVQMIVPFEVHTPEGWMKGEPGDWLATGVMGEFYPIRKDIFKETYEEIP